MTKVQPIHQSKLATSRDQALAYARKVLQMEIEGLNKLIDALDGEFIKATEKIEEMKESRSGRLIVAGIGKSGHIARKTAATLSSTGTPAFFVHPGEASHGDLGMITGQDIVIIMSNSGENTELSDLIFYTRRYSIPLIGMTSNPNSTLAKYADIKLIIPKVDEACPNGLAPTTSTTMMLAFGDALAVTLLARMELSPDQYKVFHPGGKLGKKLMKVHEIMRTGDELPIVSGDITMDRGLLVMTEKNMGSLLVLNKNGSLKGIITDGDLKRHMSPDLLQKSVIEIMSDNPKTIREDALAAEAIEIMTTRYANPITSLVVVDAQDRVKGIIRLQDCMQAGIA